VNSHPLLALALIALPACGSDAGARSALSADAARVVDGDEFGAPFGGLKLESDWSWELTSPDVEPESGRCDYRSDPTSAPTGSWQAKFSTDGLGRDPLSDEPYPNGYWTVVADGTLVQIPAHASSSPAYRCASASLEPAAAPEQMPVTVHVEMQLGMDADGVRASGYVTRLYMIGMGAPIDAANERRVLVGCSIPAPLLVQGTVEAARDDVSVGTRERDRAIVLALSGTTTPAPEFEFGLGLGIAGMLATSRVRFESMRLERTPVAP